MTQVNDCPSDQLLKAYASGTLDRMAHVSIDDHLDACPTCQGELETLDDLSDAQFHGLLVRPPPPTAYDPFLCRLQGQAIALGHVGSSPSPPPAFNCTTAQFLEGLSKAGLLPDSEIAALAKGGADAATLAGELITNGKLTEYQAQEISAGRGGDLTLGSYLLLAPVGSGGMGRVFQAFHRRMKRVVAVKILAPELIGSEAAGARFQREVEAVARLRSPHIVAAYDAGEDRGCAYLAMEYAAGLNLAELVKRQGPLSVRQALHYVLQAARGLACAHQAGIIHRDVKPANLLLTADQPTGEEVVKVLDLGLARLHAPSQSPTSGDLTTSQVVAGTAAYMAPEQAANTAQADARADIYGLGCTLYYLLTGRPPYQGENTMQMLFAHREQPIPSVRELRSDCPAEVDAAFQRMVAKQKNERPPDMSAVIATLESLLDSCRAGKRAPRRPRLVRILVGGAALAACLFLGWACLREAAVHRAQQEQNTVPATKSTDQAPTPYPDLVLIPADEFWMGATDMDADASPDEKPRHKVAITLPFLLAKYEVTQTQYEEVMGNNPSAFGPAGRYHQRVADTRALPVESLSWLNAVEFCNRLSERHGLPPYYDIQGGSVTVRGGNGYRLPTEAEWEYASRGKNTTRWHFGDQAADLSAYAWHAGNSGNVTHAVGQKKPNRFGLHDMEGNVPEWCWDRYDSDYYKVSTASDPAGSGRGMTRVFRGGGWNANAARTRPSARDTLATSYGILTPVGLRLARNASP